MKIAIFGTRGIPNHYGGFEQYAELLSTYIVENTDWEVTVYNSHNHPYQERDYKGVRIVHIHDPEYKLGTAGQFIYDLNCIRHIRNESFDIIYQLGYTSSAIFNFLLPKKSLIITNMDGLEWQRSKYNKAVQRFLKYSEKIALKHSDYLIADSIGIQKYLAQIYQASAFYSAYTATIPAQFDIQSLEPYNLSSKQYDLLIARMEPENNIETIIKGHLESTLPLIIVGNYNNKFGTYLKNSFQNHANIIFLGAIYDKFVIDNLRHYARLYFHGHSVGGTNPSLLEAMACSCHIVAHKNVFNESVLGTDALYFSNDTELKNLLNSIQPFVDNKQVEINNLSKINTIFSEFSIFSTLIDQFKYWFNIKSKNSI